VLRHVTGSRYIESIIRTDLDIGEKAIDSRVLDMVMDNGKGPPTFRQYEELITLAKSRIDEMYKEGKNIDSAMIMLQRDISRRLRN